MNRTQPDVDAAPARTPFTLAGMWRGVRDALPLAVSVLIYGMIFGLLAKTAQLSMAEAMLMSSFVFSGSAQMVAVNAMEAGRIPLGTAMFATAATILLLNARYLLYGAAIRPWLGAVSATKAYGTLAVLGDGNWILSMKAAEQGEKDAAYIFGSGAAMFVPWLVGTALGLMAGGIAADPRALGLDFMLVAFSAALAVGLMKSRGDIAVILVATATAVAADKALPPGFAVISAAAAGGVVAWLRFGREARA